MDATSICEVCGNELDPTVIICPYCSKKRRNNPLTENDETVLVVNLERGMPIVHDAMKRMEVELATAENRGHKVLVLVHGYGSSGKGGAIKNAVRRELKLRQDQKKLNDVLPGEKCGKQSRHVKHIIKRFPMLKEYALRPNPGITLVVI